MPIMLYSQPGAHTTISTVPQGPNSHLILALVVLFCINPIFGCFAVIFACSSRHVAPVDWDGARLRGKISMGLSVVGIISSVIGVLTFVLIFYTKDNNT